MLTFYKTLDIRAREVQPQVAAIYFSPGKPMYCIVGTEYGHVHTIAGDIRVWQSKSGAYSHLRKIKEAQQWN